MWRDENDNLQGFRWVSPIDIVGFARTYETAEDAIRDLVNMPRYRRAYEIRDANNNVIETIRDSKIISEEAMLWQFLQNVVVDNPMANTWHEIAAKPLIPEAVREGKPAIAFTDAETQIRRWNTDAYYWTRQSDGSVVVSGRLAMSDIEDAIELSNRNIDNETAKRIISYIDLRGGYSRNLFRFADLTFRGQGTITLNIL